MVVDEDARFNQFLAQNRQIKYRKTHFKIWNALIDHYGKTASDTNIQA
jgi:hypothetical protein